MPANTIISYPLAKSGTAFTTGKRFWVSDTTGASWQDLNLQYPPDQDGVPRVYTSITSALAQCTTGRGDEIILAADFVTAATSTEETSAETKGVTVMKAAQAFGNGSTRFVERATASLPQTTSADIFTINGKVRLLSVIGQVTTSIQNQACTAKLTAFNPSLNAVPSGATSLRSVDICATASIASDGVGTLYTITGTLATALQTGSAALLYQAAPIILNGTGSGTSTIRLKTSASNTGSVKWRVEYIPLEPAAQIIAA